MLNLNINISDIAIITVTGAGYHFITYEVSKSNAIHLKKSALDDRGCI